MRRPPPAGDAAFPRYPGRARAVHDGHHVYPAAEHAVRVYRSVKFFLFLCIFVIVFMTSSAVRVHRSVLFPSSALLLFLVDSHVSCMHSIYRLYRFILHRVAIYYVQTLSL